MCARKRQRVTPVVDGVDSIDDHWLLEGDDGEADDVGETDSDLEAVYAGIREAIALGRPLHATTLWDEWEEVEM